MNENEHGKPTDAATAPRKHAYQSPVLTEYGSVEDLVDAGVVGSIGTVPSVTTKPPPAL